MKRLFPKSLCLTVIVIGCYLPFKVFAQSVPCALPISQKTINIVKVATPANFISSCLAAIKKYYGNGLLMDYIKAFNFIITMPKNYFLFYSSIFLIKLSRRESRNLVGFIFLFRSSKYV